MRSWLLAPSGFWTEVTNRLTHLGDLPAEWDWDLLLRGIGGSCFHADGVDFFDKDSLLAARALGDRWVVNRVWDIVCGPLIDSLTAVRIDAGSNAEWLRCLRVFAGENEGSELGAHQMWEARRHRWMLWAHSASAQTPPLDGARIVVGAVGSR